MKGSFYITKLWILPNMGVPFSDSPWAKNGLNKINDHNELMINSSKWMLWLCKITVFKMISPAVFEGRYNTGQKFHQIWADWLCMLALILKMANDIILQIVILHSQSIHLLEFIISSLGSFIVLRSSFQ